MQTKRKKRNRKRGGGSGVIASVAAAYGNIISGTSYSFGKSRNAACMRMHVRYFLGSSGISPTGTTIFLIQASGLQNNAGQWYFNPMNQFYMSDCPFATISTFFLKYFLNRARLCFYTKVGSNTTGTVTVGTADDPEYFETSGVINNVTAPSKLVVTQMLNSKSLNVWEPAFNVDLKVDPRLSFFVRNQDGKGPFFSYANGAEQRLCYAGCVGINYDGVLSAGLVNTLIHDVYLEIDIELCDFSSVFVTAPSLRVGQRLALLEESLKRYESKVFVED